MKRGENKAVLHLPQAAVIFFELWCRKRNEPDRVKQNAPYGQLESGKGQRWNVRISSKYQLTNSQHRRRMYVFLIESFIADKETEVASQNIIIKEILLEKKLDAVVESSQKRPKKTIKEAVRFPTSRIKLPNVSQLPPIACTPSEILDLPAIDIDDLQKSKYHHFEIKFLELYCYCQIVLWL